MSRSRSRQKNHPGTLKSSPLESYDTESPPRNALSRIPVFDRSGEHAVPDIHRIDDYRSPRLLVSRTPRKSPDLRGDSSYRLTGPGVPAPSRRPRSRSQPAALASTDVASSVIQPTLGHKGHRGTKLRTERADRMEPGLEKPPASLKLTRFDDHSDDAHSYSPRSNPSHFGKQVDVSYRSSTLHASGDSTAHDLLAAGGKPRLPKKSHPLPTLSEPSHPPSPSMTAPARQHNRDHFPPDLPGLPTSPVQSYDDHPIVPSNPRRLSFADPSKMYTPPHAAMMVPKHVTSTTSSVSSAAWSRYGSVAPLRGVEVDAQLLAEDGTEVGRPVPLSSQSTVRPGRISRVDDIKTQGKIYDDHCKTTRDDHSLPSTPLSHPSKSLRPQKSTEFHLQRPPSRDSPLVAPFPPPSPMPIHRKRNNNVSPSDHRLPSIASDSAQIMPSLGTLEGKSSQPVKNESLPGKNSPLMLYPDSRLQEPTKFDSLNESISHARIPISPASRPPEGSPIESRRYPTATSHLQGIQGNDGRDIPSIHISEGSRRVDVSKRRERLDGSIQAGSTMSKHLESYPNTTDPSNGLTMRHQSTGRTRSPRLQGRQEPSPYPPPVDVEDGSRKPDRSPKSPLLSVPSRTPQTGLSDDVSRGSSSRRPAANPRSKAKLSASQTPGEKTQILSRENRSAEDNQSNVHIGESQPVGSLRLTRTNKTMVVNDESMRADTSPLMKRTTMFRPHQLHSKDSPLEDDIVKRMSLLRRITTSPNPQTLPQPRLAKDPSQYAPAHGFSVGGNQLPFDNPFFLTLDDALSKPYDASSLVHASQYARQSWAEAQDASEQVWTPVDEPNQQVPHDSFDSGYRDTRTGKNRDAKTVAVPPATLGPGTFSSIESDISSIVTDENRFSDETTSFSGAAEELFKTLDVQSLIPPRTKYMEKSDDTTHIHSQSSNKELHRPLSFSPVPSTWRETLTEDAYNILLARYDLFEMRRQEVIWDLCQSEDDFVQSLQVVLRLFVQPLRSENGTQWIPGLEPDVAKLFDWLDDITQLHTQLLTTMRGCRTNQLPIVTQIAESLRPFVSKLEIHQPYLVRVDDVTQLIKQMIEDPSSDFGEFVRIQSTASDCSRPLPVLLQKPVERLFKYPDYFKLLFGLTPRSHSDHLSMFSLLHSTDMMIRVLQTVKNREAEYAMMKVLSTRITGLPVNFQLASRDRRLIAQGPLLRRHLPHTEENIPDTYLSDMEPSTHPRMFENHLAPMRSQKSPRNSPHPAYKTRTTTFNEAILTSAESSPSDWSFAENPISTSPVNYDLSPDLGSMSFKQESLQHFLPNEDLPWTARHQKLNDEWIYAFVFTDVVLLTTPSAKELGAPWTNSKGIGGQMTDSWVLLEDVGLARVLGFSDLSGDHHEHLLAVDLLPLEQDTEFHQIAPTPVYLSLAERATGRMALQPIKVLQDARQQWTSAFNRCYMHTMRSLSFPGSYGLHRGNYLEPGQSDDREHSNSMSVLSSGQPLPTSPSVQLQAVDSSPITQEREERSWWAARFQHVLREISSQDELENRVATPAPQVVNERQTSDPFAEPSPQRPSRPLSIISKSRLFKLKK